MKTKREVLEEFARKGYCNITNCFECPYKNNSGCELDHYTLIKIGAMAILRQDRKKRRFNPNKVLTCVTADKAKVGIKGYFADSLTVLREEFAQKNIYTLTRILSEDACGRFEADNYLNWILFYPIDEELAE